MKRPGDDSSILTVLGGPTGSVPIPRSARPKSKSGIYLVMLRGIDRQKIF